jgi:hypothetical protein
VENEVREEFGWIDDRGELRPRDWDEYCRMVRKASDWQTTHRLMSKHGEFFFNQESKRKGHTLQPPMRLRLFRANPACFWCGCAVILECDQSRPDFATVDHLYSRYHPQRESRHRRQDGVLHVLACRVCNHERASCEERRVPFVPKLPERLSFAQKADATVARANARAALRTELGVTNVQPSYQPLCTIEEAIAFARKDRGGSDAE